MAEGERHVLHGAGKERMRTKGRGKPLIKPSDLMRVYFTTMRTVLGKLPPRFNYLPLGPSYNIRELRDLQFKVRLW